MYLQQRLSVLYKCSELLEEWSVFSGVFAAVVKTPPSNLWILAILTPLFLLMVVIGMVAFIFCQKNRVIFKTGAFRTFRTRAKVRGLSSSLFHFWVRLIINLPLV